MMSWELRFHNRRTRPGTSSRPTSQPPSSFPGSSHPRSQAPAWERTCAWKLQLPVLNRQRIQLHHPYPPPQHPPCTRLSPIGRPYISPPHRVPHPTLRLENTLPRSGSWTRLGRYAVFFLFPRSRVGTHTGLS